MKRIRKFLVLAMAMVMALAMNITAFAEDPSLDVTPTAATVGTATITIEGLEAGDVVKYLPLIVADPTVADGWKIVNGATEIGTIADFKALSEKEQNAAVSGITATETANVSGNVITVDNAGMYLINIIAKEGSEYVYQPMLVYVPFEYVNGIAKLVDQTVSAKKGKNILVKDADMQFAETGEIVTYTVTAHVPYVPKGVEVGDDIDYIFAIKDTLTGGEYIKENDTVKVSYTLAGQPGTADIDVLFDENANSTTVVLDALIDDDNSNAQKEVAITYQAKLTDPEVMENTAIPVFWDHEGDPTSFKVVAGHINILKTDDGQGEAAKPLDGAEFIIFKTTEEGVTVYATFETIDGKNVLSGWTSNKDDAGKITTLEDGIATAYGFDRDVEDVTYKAEEVKAPKGYSVKSDALTITWTTEKYEQEGVKSSVIVSQIGEASLADTPLIELPYTGGSGTAAFTGFGVLLMSLAAGLYFYNKKKATK